MNLTYPGRTAPQQAAAAAFVAIMAATSTTAGAQTYPTKPVRLIVPFAPGGTSDIMARLVAPRLGADLGQQVLVDNRAGAGSMLGTELTAKAAPDGYTLVLNNIGLALNETIYPKRNYDALRDLAPVSLLGITPNMFVVHPSLPARTVREFVAIGKARPGQLAYASGGIGSSSHLAGELLQIMAGIKAVHVPYKGAGPALIDVASGQVHFMINSMPAVMGLVQNGRLRALAVSGSKRSPAAPEVPTIAESGVPGYEFATWYGLLAPTATPAGVIGRLNEAVQKSLRENDLREKLLQQGVEPEASTPQRFGDMLRNDIAKWRKVIRDANITVN